MRIVKEHGERRAEIVTAAINLFAERGFTNTSVNDILSAVNIAKGTFYYYFKSKEDVLDAAIDDYMAAVSKNVDSIVNNLRMNAIEKLIGAIIAASNKDDERKWRIIDAVTQPGNELFYQKTFNVTTNVMLPIFTRIIEEGGANGEFSVDYPRTSAEVILMGIETMFDNRLTSMTAEESAQKLVEFIFIFERILGVEKGTIIAYAEKLRELL